MRRKIFSLFLTGALLTASLVLGQAEVAVKKIEVRSSAFGEGERIPSEFTCDGANVSPPIVWSGIPPHTQSIAIIVDDPDVPSGDWAHWVIYDLPPSLMGIQAGAPASEKLPAGGIQGRTNFGRIGYGGPCPPKGAHRYFFKVYTLDAMLHLKSGATKKELLEAMRGHVLGEGALMGRYERS